MKPLHAAIISWQGLAQGARHIAQAIDGHVDQLTVVYSNPQGAPESGPGDWVSVDNSVFFGGKFQCSITRGEHDIFLLIHADASCDDWPALIRRCRAVHANDNIGVWAPAIDYTPWLDSRVELARAPASQLAFVAQTNGIVFSMSKPVIQRLKELDYSQNNLGWGIDWIAICYSYANNLHVVRDHSLKLRHPAGSGYQGDLARTQMANFLTQMTLQEQLIYTLLNSHIHKQMITATAQPTIGNSGVPNEQVVAG